MRIVMSLLAFRPGQIGGTETYLRRMLEHLPAHAGSDELAVVVPRDVAREVPAGWDVDVVERSDAQLVTERILEAYTPYRSRSLETAFAGDVAFFPQHSIFPFRVNAPAVITVHDLQHLVFPRNFGPFDATFRARAYPRSEARAARIIAISQSTRRELIALCGAPPEKIAVVPHGHSPSPPASVAPWNAGGPYIYYPAATNDHKGHDVLLRSVAALRDRGEFPYRVVFTGWQTSRWKTLRRLIHRLRLDDLVVHLGFVPFETVHRVYAGATAVVFPTSYEGFGLPVLEAFEYARKVIVSRLSVFDEIGVPAEWQIDFSKPEQLSRALRMTGRTVLRRRPVTWAESARATLDILRSAAGRRP